MEANESSQAPQSSEVAAPKTAEAAPQNEFASQFESLRREVEETRAKTSESDKVLSSLREVLSGKKEVAQDKLEEMLSMLDKAGKDELPLTRTALTEVKNLRSKTAEYEQKIKDLEEKINKVNDPNVYSDTVAYNDAGLMITQGLESIYGQDFPEPLREAAAKLVGKQIEEIQKDPKTWTRLKSDKAQLKALVDKEILRIVPDKARKFLHEQKIASHEPSLAELHAALEEAGKYNNPQLRAAETHRIRSLIRAKSMKENTRSGLGQSRYLRQ